MNTTEDSKLPNSSPVRSREWLEAYLAGMTHAAKLLIKKNPKRSRDAESYAPTLWGDKRIGELHSKILAERDRIKASNATELSHTAGSRAQTKEKNNL